MRGRKLAALLGSHIFAALYPKFQGKAIDLGTKAVTVKLWLKMSLTIVFSTGDGRNVDGQDAGGVRDDDNGLRTDEVGTLLVGGLSRLDLRRGVPLLLVVILRAGAMFTVQDNDCQHPHSTTGKPFSKQFHVQSRTAMTVAVYSRLVQIEKVTITEKRPENEYAPARPTRDIGRLPSKRTPIRHYAGLVGSKQASQTQCK